MCILKIIKEYLVEERLCVIFKLSSKMFFFNVVKLDSFMSRVLT